MRACGGFSTSAAAFQNGTFPEVLAGVMTVAGASSPLKTEIVGVAPDDLVVSMVRAIGRGESGALAVFYESWFDRAFDLARGLTRRDEAFCLDVVQEAMMKVIKKLNPSLGIRTRASLDAWFTRVVHTTAIDALRREARRRQRDAARAGPAARQGPDHPSAIDLAHIEERLAWLGSELRRLEGEEASLVTLRFAQDKSLEAVGEEHGMTAGAVHGRIRRLIERLRRSGKERFHDEAH